MSDTCGVHADPTWNDGWSSGVLQAIETVRAEFGGWDK